MLATEQFVERLVALGFSHCCAVPCSFATPLINAAINHPRLRYIPCASEAVACSVAAGLKMSGARPLVVAQSSGLTNMGSCITSLLKPYGVHIAMLVSWRSYAEGDSEIQHQHLATHLPELVAAYGYQWAPLQRGDLEAAAQQLQAADRSATLLLLEPDSFSPVGLETAPPALDTYPPRSAYLAQLNTRFAGTDTAFVGTTGHTAREMYTFMPDTRNFYMAGNMGGALSIAYGASLAGRAVVACGGDAEHMMHLGGMVTAGSGQHPTAPLLYIVFDNQSNKSTGGQASNNTHLDYPALARACGLHPLDQSVTDLPTFAAALQRWQDHGSEPAFLHARCCYDPVTPRPPAQAIRASSGAFLSATARSGD